MKILFIAPRFHTNYLPYIKAIKEKGYFSDFFVVYKWKSENYNFLTPVILKYSIVFKLLNFINKFFKKWYLHNSFELTFWSPSFLNLFIKIKKNKPDLIFVKWVQNIMTLYSLLIWRLLGIKTLVHIQTEIYWDISVKKRVFVWILKNIFWSVISSPILWNQVLYKEKFDIDLLPFIQEEIDFKKHYFKDWNINIISVWKFVERKDQLLLVDAFIELQKKYLNLNLTLIWELVDKQYINNINWIIKKAWLENKIKILFNITIDEVFDIYKKSDLFILPAYREPASISPIEAMSFCLPVISSDENWTKCYIEEWINWYVFKAKNKNSLIKSIESIIEDKDNIPKMWISSLNLMKNKYSDKVFIDYLSKNI